MTKEEFKLKRAQILSNIDSLNKQEEEMCCAYLTEHCPFHPGDKVKVIAESRWQDTPPTEYIAFIKNFWVDLDGNLQYRFWKCRKDGTESNHKLHLYSDNIKIELIEKAKQ